MPAFRGPRFHWGFHAGPQLLTSSEIIGLCSYVYSIHSSDMHVSDEFHMKPFAFGFASRKYAYSDTIELLLPKITSGWHMDPFQGYQFLCTLSAGKQEVENQTVATENDRNTT